ncbi:NUDIX hydrolase [Streptomyces megasporus]|uniref:NUDIX hydrolase n=1 Tax=Streptomyces megasporus TaxID=44060 RepID=UPI00068AC9EB|nr:NUDIX domain-containing protein [Streptomyces megasporus]
MGGRVVVGALIRDPDDRIFVQQRSEDRRLFPGCWDIVGGAVEDGESLLAALRREIREETGWELDRVLTRLPPRTWEADGHRHTEYDYVVEVRGDLAAPRLEWDKHPRYTWLGPDGISILHADAERTGSSFIVDSVSAAHRWLAATPERSCRAAEQPLPHEPRP